MQSKLFVGNINFDTTADDLRQLFSEAGQVVSVALPTDRDTGRPRGFAFVEFSSDDEASAAIEKFSGYELHGRALRVDEAGERPPRVPGFRPGGGGGGGGGFGQDRPAPRSRPKGSRRNIRSRKRSIY